MCCENKRNQAGNQEVKRAIAILYSPKSLMDFMWFYCEYGQQYKWDVCCISTGMRVEIEEQVRNSQIFNNVYIDEETFLKKSNLDKLKMFLGMLFFYVTGRRKKYIQRFIDKRFKYDDYELIVTTPENSLLGGFLISLSDAKETFILEDGARDYANRHRLFVKDKMGTSNVVLLIGLILSKMKYGDPSMYFRFEPTKNCVKCSSWPEKMVYGNYKAILRIGEFSNQNVHLYNQLVNTTFSINIPESVDAVLYTSPLVDSVGIDNKSYAQITNYFNQEYGGKTILVKKHVRDKEEYLFSDKINAIYADERIPGELIANRLKNVKSYFMWPSTLISNVNDYNVFFIEDAAMNSTLYTFNEFLRAMELVNAEEKKVLKI